MQQMNNKRVSISLAVLAVVVVSIVAFAVPEALAIGSIYIVPAALDDPTIAPGSTFKINASAANILDLFTWQIQVEFDPTILQCASASIPATSIFRFDFTPSAVIDNALGTAYLGSSKLFGAGANGSDALATFEFSVVKRGYSHLNYSKPLGNGTFLLDPAQRIIPLTIEDGHFDNHLPGTQSRLTIQVAGSGTTNPAAGVYIYDVSSKVHVDAIPLSGWKLDHWELDTINVGSNDSYEVTMHTDHILKAAFVRIQHYLTIEVAGSGTTDPAPGNYIYDEGATFQVYAFPASGWNLDHWERDAVIEGSGNPYKGVMNTNQVLKAVFTKIPSPQHQLTVQVAGSGTTSPAAGNYSYDEGSRVSVDAIPASDWAFDHWELDNVSVVYVNPYEVGMDADHVLLAVFVQISSTPDNAVVDVVSKTVVGKGCAMNITVTVKNQGLFTATWRSRVNVTVYYNSTIITLPDGKTFVAIDLGRGELVEITVVWNISVTDVPEGNYVLSAYVSPVPFETDLADNSLGDRWVCVTIAGNVVGPPNTINAPDNVVNMRDIGAICNVFGATPSAPDWNPNMDINNDGVADMYDIDIACSNFGKTSPQNLLPYRV